MGTKLVVGLGNPGLRYANTRHNAGYLAAEAIATALRATPWTTAYGGLVAEAVVGDVRVVILKPVDAERGINGSGSAVARATASLGLAPADVVVVHDEMAIGPGDVRAKVGGGDAGHNGLKSVTGSIGPDYARVRIGIGHPGTRDAVTGHVLGEFGPEREAVEAVYAGVVQAVPELLSGRLDAFLERARAAVVAAMDEALPKPR